MNGSFLQADVASKTGVPPRTIQFWVTNGVLEPTPATKKTGSGVHRRYSAGEVEIAAVLAELTKFSISVGLLRSFAQWLRDIQRAGKKYSAVGSEAAKSFLSEQWYLHERDSDHIKMVIKIAGSEYKALGGLGLGHLEHPPSGKPKISKEEVAAGFKWVEYERARKSRWGADTSENIAIFLAIGDDGKWESELSFEGVDWLDKDNDLKIKFDPFDTMITIKLSRIFSRLWREEDASTDAVV
jgi:DNA-binding transcriptional MerR regulator